MPAGLAPPPGPADQAEEEERSDGSAVRAGLRGIGLPALVAVAVGALLVVVYLAAFPTADPHDLPVGVVGTDAQVADVSRALDRDRPGPCGWSGSTTPRPPRGRSPPARSTARSSSAARHPGCWSPGRTGRR
ncbi:hypothetical protein [Trujillonella humicola]|uniref:hypothetical protein n=1 Tax=Trujillonella humicola TaxID=3383699 RepID=UPI00390580BE